MKNQIRNQFKELIQRMGLLEEQQTKCCNLSLVQCHVLTEVGDTEGMSINELSEKLHLDKSTTSRHVSNLVKSNLVSRVENTQDRRYFTLHLTDLGKTTYKSINNTMDHYYATLLDSLSKEEQEKVNEALKLVKNAIDDLGCC